MRRHTKEMTHAKRYNFIIKPEIHIKRNVEEKMYHSFYEMIGDWTKNWGIYFLNIFLKKLKKNHFSVH